MELILPVDSSDITDETALFRVVALVAPEKKYNFGEEDQFRTQARYTRLLTDMYADYVTLDENGVKPYRLKRISFSTIEILSREGLEGSLFDIREANSRSRRDNDDVRAVDMIHYIGHGDSAEISFPDGDSLKLTKKEDRRMFGGLGLDVLLFSCCRFGRNKRVLSRLAEESDTGMVIAYKADVLAHEAFLIDSLVYHLVYGEDIRRRMNFGQIGQRLETIIKAGLIYHRGTGGGDDPLAWVI